MEKLSTIKDYFEQLFEVYPELSRSELPVHLEFLFSQVEKVDRYEDLALEHHYQTILDEMD